MPAYVDVGGLSRLGREPATHFRGVTTVVRSCSTSRIPTGRTSGQKDAQLAVVLQMVRDLNIPSDRWMPIVREPDGLAMSSRNVSLTPERRPAARSLPVASAGGVAGRGGTARCGGIRAC
jgi:pantoate--beta-alanine ligase